MKKCPFCAEEIQDEAVKCKHCGSDLVAMMDNTANTSMYSMLAGFSGAGALFVGLFMPIIRVPVVGHVNYFNINNGKGAGIVLVVLTFASMAIIIKKKFEWLLTTALPSSILVILTFLELQYRIGKITSVMQSGAAESPFGGIAKLLIGTFQFGYGWVFLTAGCILLLAAVLIDNYGQNTCKTAFDQTTIKIPGCRRVFGIQRQIWISSCVVIILAVGVWFVEFVGIPDLLGKRTGEASLVSQSENDKQEPASDFSQTLEVVSVEGTIRSKDYNLDRFTTSVQVSPIIRNLTDKTIVGIKGRIFVLDGFNKEVGSFNFNDSERLLPGNTTSGGYVFEDNIFINNEVFDLISPVISGGTAQFRVVIRDVAFGKSTERTEGEEGTAKGSKENVDSTAVTGKVAETMDAAGNTYVRLDVGSGKEIWAAIPKTELKLGEKISLQSGSEMENFFSKTLNKNFEKIIFATGISKE